MLNRTSTCSTVAPQESLPLVAKGYFLRVSMAVMKNHDQTARWGGKDSFGVLKRDTTITATLIKKDISLVLA